MPMPELLITKVVVAVLVVSALSLIADRVSPAWAGILSGFPTGSAITLYFYAQENGTKFAADAALYNVSGMLLLLLCCGGYYLGAVVWPRSGIAGRLGLGLACYSLGGAGLGLLQLAPWSALLIAAGSTAVCWVLFRQAGGGKITEPRPLTVGRLCFRAVIAAAIIVAVTAVAGLVGPRWAGLFSAFPATLFPLLLIVDLAYGPAAAAAVIRHVPRGLPALILFSLTLHCVWPGLGLAAGMLLAFAAAGCYLLVLKLVNSLAPAAPSDG